MSARGFPSKRVEAYLAGMITAIFIDGNISKQDSKSKEICFTPSPLVEREDEARGEGGFVVVDTEQTLC